MGEESHWEAWVAVTGCSAVVLGAFEVATSSTNRSTKNKWVVAGTSIVMALGLLAVIASRVMKGKFYGSMIERGTAILCLGMWCGLLAVLMDPANGYAQTGQDAFRGVNNANMYFFSWGAFIASLYTVAKLSQEALMARFNEVPRKMIHWFSITATSVVVLWAAVNFYRDYDDDLPNGCSDASGDQKETCRRTQYAFAIGAFGVIVGLCAIIFSKFGCWPLLVELVLGFILFGLFAVGVGVVTFNTGPGTQINNLYFSTWIGVIMTCYLFLGTFREFLEGRSQGEEDVNDKDMEVEEEEVEEGEAEEGVEEEEVKEKSAPEETDTSKQEA